METSRLEAFSDGVIAVIITIMVLELKAPHGIGLASLRPIVPTLLIYALSFVNVGIYWNNHHHLFRIVKRLDGRSMWANLHLLFWLSLVPFVTTWFGENPFARVPTALFALVLLMSAAAFTLLVAALRTISENESLSRALGGDGKSKFSVAAYAAGCVLAFVWPPATVALIVIVAIVWFVPDRRIERQIATE